MALNRGSEYTLAGGEDPGAAPDAVLLVRGICKSFPGVKALDGVSLAIRRGTVHALLGENGAGKSTLMNIIAGVYPPDSGQMWLDGRRVAFRNTREAREAGVSTIFQELNLIPHLTVAQNIFLGREPLSRTGLIDDGLMRQEAANWLRRLNLDVSPRALVGDLRVGQQQVVEIAKALSLQARVIIMDEPTSAITQQEVDTLHTLIRQLKHDGVALIYITHKLDELPLIADDVTVLRDGRHVGTRAASSVDRDEMVRMMVGRDLSEIFSRAPTEPGEELLRVKGLSLPHARRAGDLALRDVSLYLRRGEILGIFGLLGSGRTELLETLFGLHAGRARGMVTVDGVRAWFRSPRDAIAAGVVLAPEDRRREGLVLSLSVAANSSLAAIDRVERHGLLDSGLERDLAEHYARRLRTKTWSVDQLVRDLSGGSQQKVVLAKWLATRPKVLLLDEPTRGIDVNAKREIYDLMDELVRDGLGVIFVSSELPEVLGISDRILVMSEGTVTAEVSRADASEERIMTAALPCGVGRGRRQESSAGLPDEGDGSAP